MVLQKWASLLNILNWVVGLTFTVVSVWRFVAQDLLGPLVLLVGLIVVGPVEDFLKAWLPKQKPTPGDDVSQVINQATSLVLVISLLVASLLF